MRVLVTALCALFIFSGCLSLKEPQFTGLKGLHIEKISTEGIEGDVILGIRNPNRWGFRVYRSEFDVTYSGIHIGKARLAKSVRIKGGDEGNYRFKLKTDFKNVNLADVLKLLNAASRKDVLEVKGDIRAGRLLYRRSFPVDLRENLGIMK